MSRTPPQQPSQKDPDDPEWLRAVGVVWRYLRQSDHGILTVNQIDMFLKACQVWVDLQMITTSSFTITTLIKIQRHYVLQTCPISIRCPSTLNNNFFRCPRTKNYWLKYRNGDPKSTFVLSMFGYQQVRYQYPQLPSNVLS